VGSGEYAEVLNKNKKGLGEDDKINRPPRVWGRRKGGGGSNDNQVNSYAGKKTHGGSRATGATLEESLEGGAKKSRKNGQLGQPFAWGLVLR